MFKQSTVTMLLAAALPVAWAQNSPAGLWKTIDDDTKQDRSLVRIAEANGVFSGTIEKLLDPKANQAATCKKCSDDRKDKPIIGFALVRNVKQNGDNPTVWDGGDITDPENGKVYRVRLRPVDGGKQLEVRGYVGPFYRTQHWVRVE